MTLHKALQPMNDIDVFIFQETKRVEKSPMLSIVWKWQFWGAIYKQKEQRKTDYSSQKQQYQK